MARGCKSHQEVVHLTAVARLSVMVLDCRSLIVAAFCLLLLGCTREGSVLQPDANDSFAIYIAANRVDEDGAADIDSLDLLQPAFLSGSDLSSYEWSEHRLTYASPVWERLKTWGDLLHRIFAVTVGAERVYCGLFMDDLDSSACQNPVIMLLPRRPDGRNTIPLSLSIERAYPEYLGNPDDPDPRKDPRIYEALDKAGVLVP